MFFVEHITHSLPFYGLGPFHRHRKVKARTTTSWGICFCFECDWTGHLLMSVVFFLCEFLSLLSKGWWYEVAHAWEQQNIAISWKLNRMFTNILWILWYVGFSFLSCASSFLLVGRRGMGILCTFGFMFHVFSDHIWIVHVCVLTAVLGVQSLMIMLAGCNFFVKLIS